MKPGGTGKTDQYSFILAPSAIAGIGVFATHAIKKHTKLRLFSNEDSQIIPHNSPLLKLPRVRWFCQWYGVEDVDGYHCPKNFGKMDIGWYVNHSKMPNAYQQTSIYYAARDIKKGEEILIDYETLSSIPQILLPLNPQLPVCCPAVENKGTGR